MAQNCIFDYSLLSRSYFHRQATNGVGVLCQELSAGVDHGIQISMDGKGRWVDNVFIERLWRSVKYEEVYLKSYETMKEARESLKRYFDFYNRGRSHQTLDYRTPDDVYTERPLE